MTCYRIQQEADMEQQRHRKQLAHSLNPSGATKILFLGEGKKRNRLQREERKEPLGGRISLFSRADGEGKGRRR